MVCLLPCDIKFSKHVDNNARNRCRCKIHTLIAYRNYDYDNEIALHVIVCVALGVWLLPLFLFVILICNICTGHIKLKLICKLIYI